MDFIAKYYYAALLIQPVSKFYRELNSSTVNKHRIAICCLTLFAAGSSIAVSLGRQGGAALIGRPLDMTVQAILDTQDDPASLCLEADVFYADVKVDASRVRVFVDRVGAGSRDAVIHIRASAVINEPVVSVQLRMGCRQKIEKRYVLLADLASDSGSQLNALPVVPGSAAAAAGVLPSTLPGGAAQVATSPPTSTRSSVPRSPRTSPRNNADKTAPSAAANSPRRAPNKLGEVVAAGKQSTVLSAVTGQRLKAGTVPGKIGSRLKLDPLDLTAERDPQLKSSQELLSVPAATEQERSVAAALWRALSAQPDDMLKNMEKLKVLEDTVKTLQTQNQQSQRTINELNASLQQAQTQRYANFLVYFLASLLLLALLFAAYLWRQRSRLAETYDEQLPWWRKNRAQEKGWTNLAQDSNIALDGSGALTSQTVFRRAAKNKPADLDLDLGSEDSDFADIDVSSRRSHQVSVMPLASRDRSDFGMSMTHMSRAVKAEELFDVQQQADFFVSLGQHEQAIEVLRNHIGEIGQTSAMVYLDLFNLYHQLGRKAEYEALRDDFNQRFNARIPSFDQHAIGSLGLEAYGEALQRIEALWPSPKVLEVIEESIFRGSDANAESFDLEAYREMLLLYAIAKDVTGGLSPSADEIAAQLRVAESNVDESTLQASKFLATSIQPLSAIAGETKPAILALDTIPGVPRASPRLGLDVDLNEFDAPDSPHVEELQPDDIFFEELAQNAAPHLGTSPADPAAIVQKPSEASIDNLIDFDNFSSSVNFHRKPKPPKV